MKKNILNINYFLDFGLHLGRRFFNRSSSIYNTVLGSRDSWDILNIEEILIKLKKLGPILIKIIKNGGTILIVTKEEEDENMLYLQEFFERTPFENVVKVFSEKWIHGSLTRMLEARFFNLRQLPSIIFVFDFVNYEDLLHEAKLLRIPVVGLVNSYFDTTKIAKYITFPIISGNSYKSIFFFFFFLQYYIKRGMSYLNYNNRKEGLLLQYYKFFYSPRNINSKNYKKFKNDYNFRRHIQYIYGLPLGEKNILLNYYGTIDSEKQNDAAEIKKWFEFRLRMGQIQRFKRKVKRLDMKPAEKFLEKYTYYKANKKKRNFQINLSKVKESLFINNEN